MANVSVYMGAACGSKPLYVQTARELGSALARNSHKVIYGGANVGTMKALADGVCAENGYLIGVYPEGFMGREEVQSTNVEVLRKDMNETIFEPDFGARIARMDALSDACIVLPGGFGTFQELFSYMVNQQIGKHSKPVILFNLDGFYDTLLDFFTQVENAGFVTLNPQRLRVVTSIEEIIDILGTLD